MATDRPMTLRLPPEIFDAMVSAAHERAMSPPALAGEIVYQWALDEGLLQKRDEGRLRAQRDLLKWVQDRAEQRRDADDWDEHITREIFEAIALEKGDLYAQAAQGAAKTPLNREIGALVRRVLGAEVREERGQRMYGQVPRGQPSLIRTYTYLFRPGKSERSTSSAAGSQA